MKWVRLHFPDFLADVLLHLFVPEEEQAVEVPPLPAWPNGGERKKEILGHLEKHFCKLHSLKSQRRMIMSLIKITNFQSSQTKVRVSVSLYLSPTAFPDSSISKYPPLIKCYLSHTSLFAKLTRHICFLLPKQETQFL